MIRLLASCDTDELGFCCQIGLLGFAGRLRSTRSVTVLFLSLLLHVLRVCQESLSLRPGCLVHGVVLQVRGYGALVKLDGTDRK